MGAFKRKVYGKVKPVPKPKEKAPDKPIVYDLRAIYAQIKRSPEQVHNDLLSEALLWWAGAIKYCQWKYRKMFPLEAARAYAAAQDLAKKGREAETNKEKTKLFVEALAKYRRYAAGVLKIPDLAPYLKASKDVTKRSQIVNKKISAKFDSLLTLLMQCFDCDVNFNVAEQLYDADGDPVERKWDHALGTVVYSRAKLNAMKKQLFHRGLLSLVLEEADFIARGMSLCPGIGKGSFIHNVPEHLRYYRQLLSNFERFAGTTAAPKMLVKRVRTKKKKEKVDV